MRVGSEGPGSCGYAPPTVLRSRLVPTLSPMFVAALALASCSGDDDVDRSVIDVAPRGPGTCLDFGEEVGAEVTELPVVPCEEPHTHEIFAVLLSQADTYPGLEALEADAQARCLRPFEDYVGVSAFDSELFYSWLVPTLTSWDREDDREIICVAGEGDGAKLVGSVRGVAR